MLAKPTFYEFFAGGGMARAGLGDDWQCLFANDFDAKKVETYKANWGDKEIVHCDIYDLETSQLPGQADLAWASFPCQDLSLAGNGEGLRGERSGTFWGFYRIVQNLKAERRAPKTLVLENVVGILTSNGGADFVEVCRAVAALGYVFGAMVIDAVEFLPQSRPRFFLVAALPKTISPGAFGDGPDELWHPASLRRAHLHLRPDLKARWRWWKLPKPGRRGTDLIDLIEDSPSDVEWHSAAETRRLVSMMSPINLERLANAKSAKTRIVGTAYRRTRPDELGGKIQRVELRTDGVAGCLRTPGGGSSRQFVLEIKGMRVRSRLLSSREAARLMGLPDSYKLPTTYNEAYHLLGDGLAVPVVAHVARLAAAFCAHDEFRMQAAE
jgi:DNA (cytosine-5)-methyltransferase 1